jgi:hypothetical protein
VCFIEDISSEKIPLEDREMNAFLDEEYKKKVSNKIRQRNREKSFEAWIYLVLLLISLRITLHQNHPNCYQR